MRKTSIGSAALAGAAALSLVAGASGAQAAVTVGDSIEAFIGSNMVGVNGYPSGTDVWVERNGVVVAQAVDVIGASGATVLNHDDCFDATTPDILAGDVIKAAPNVGDAGADSMTVQDVFLDQNIAAPVGTSVTIAGSVAQAGDYAFQFRFGGADRHNATLSLGAGAFSRTLTLTAAQAADWPFAEATLESTNGAGTELTISDAEGGAGPGCPPLAQSSAIASSTLLAAGQDLVLTGVAAAGITPEVAINGGAPSAVTPAGGSWSRTVLASELAEGANQVVVTFTGAGAPPAKTFTVVKDTVAPGAPSTTPPGGTYTEGQSVTLGGVEASQAYYTLDGSEPTKGSTRYTGAIAIPDDATLKVAQYDAAGNRGPTAIHAYVIQAPAAPVRRTQPPAAQPILVLAPQRVLAPAGNVVAAGALRVGGSRSLRSLRRTGLRFSVSTPASTRYVLARLTRLTTKNGRTKRALVQERIVQVTAGGAYRGTLKIGKRLKAGRYELSVAAAGADEAYSSPVRTRLALTR